MNVVCIKMAARKVSEPRPGDLQHEENAREGSSLGWLSWGMWNRAWHRNFAVQACFSDMLMRQTGVD